MRLFQFVHDCVRMVLLNYANIVCRRALCISPLSFMVPSKTSHKLPFVHKRHPLLFSSLPCIRAWTYTMVVLYKCNCCSQFHFNFRCCSMLVYASLEQLQHALVQITCIQNIRKKYIQIRRWTANLEWQALCLDNIVINVWCAEILWDIFR